jgi:chloride channel protein, CIC family
MTGGAFGSMIAQLFKLTSNERKTLLVAGAAGGMAATFAAPVASVLLAVELLLFEWKPRSLVPVALASVTAAAARRYIIGMGPLFPVPAHPVFIGPQGCFRACWWASRRAAIGAADAGGLCGGGCLPPAAHSLDVVAGHRRPGDRTGRIDLPASARRGVRNHRRAVAGGSAAQMIVGILLVKSVIWAVSLGSGTSGGVLAPLLMMGGALGGIEAMFLPHEGAGFWPLVSMGAILGGTMRSPFTGVIFALELTHDVNMLLPLLLAVTIAHAFTVLTLRRSILTEKVARRGYHLSREYAVDPLEILFRAGSDAHQRGSHSGAADGAGVGALAPYRSHGASRPASVSGGGRRTAPGGCGHAQGSGTLREGRHGTEAQGPVVAYPDEPLRVVAHRMSDTGLTRFPVVNNDRERKLTGMVALSDLLRARTRNLEEERHRERVLRLHLPLSAKNA